MKNTTVRQTRQEDELSSRERGRAAAEHDAPAARRAMAHDSRWRGVGAAEQSDLLGRVSHELRSPLAAIKGYAATLRRHECRLSVEERTEYLRAIEDAVSRLDTVIERMLLLSQLESGSVVPIRAPVDLDHLVLEAVSAAQVSREAGTQRHPIRLTIQPDSATVVEGDPRLLRVVLDHLIENAIKFSQVGDTIAVGLTHRTTRDSCAETPSVAEVTVRNVGRAIPPEHIARIFERFHQADGGLTREVGGLGLGLTICQRILTLHGGSLAARSETDGSTFILRLPLST